MTFLQRYYFNDLAHAEKVLRASVWGGIYFNLRKTLDQGYIDLYAMDEDHAERIAAKYNARRGEFLTKPEQNN